MSKLPYTHLVYLNDTIPPKIWDLYATFCTKIKINEIEKYVMLCSDIEFGQFFLQVKAHFKNSTINLRLPNSLVLLLQEVASVEKKTVLGFAPTVSL